jgi:hypothetical protein
MVNVGSATTDSVYFFHFGEGNSTSLFFGKVFVQNDGFGNIAFGVAKRSNSAVIFTTLSYLLNTTYLIVVKYTFNTGSTTDDEVKLWVNPVLNGTEPASDLTQTDTGTDADSLSFFALRQATNGPGLVFGGLRVATTWVPEGGANTFQLSVNVTNGWNMVSVPGINTNGMGINNWWINHVGNVFKFSSGYVSIAATTPGEGYWMKNNGPQTYNTGDEWPAGGIQIIPHNPIPGALGWNLIGGYEEVVPADAAHVTSNPAGKVVFPIYKYSGGYQVAATLDPGYAYWVKLSAAAQILLSATPLAKDEVEYFPEGWGKIVLTDAAGVNYTLYAVKGEVDLSQYELPPAPPTGMFDIRFESGRIAEDINSSVKTIDMSGITYPLTVKVEGMDIRLQDETGKIVNANLKSGEAIVVSDATIEKLMVSGELIPTVYSLEQNYPNPFNPSTTIEFSLPENVDNVRLSIYNVLGEKVAELVNTALVAGKYSYQWNAQNVATGMYIYELRTDKLVSIKKMVLLK